MTARSEIYELLKRMTKEKCLIETKNIKNLIENKIKHNNKSMI